MERAISAHIPVEPVTNSETPPPARLSGRWLRTARTLWMITAVLAVLVLIVSIPGYMLLAEKGVAPNQVKPLTSLEQLASALSAILSFGVALVSILLAGLIFGHRSVERMAMFVSFYLLLHGIIVGGPLEVLELSLHGSSDFVQHVIQPSFDTALIVTLFSTFPDGRFIPGWTRWLTLLTVLLIPLPFIVDFVSLIKISAPFTIAIGVIWVSALYAQIYRYRCVSSPEQRQQTKWVVFGFGLMVLFIILSSFPYVYFLNWPADTPIPWWYYAETLVFWWPAMFAAPITLSVAILRYRLWDIDIFINRTLVYGALTACVITIYVAIVGLAGALLQTDSSLPESLLATGFAAVLFQPLRERLQRGVNRLMFGERDEPYSVLGRLAERLEVVVASQSVLPTIVETIAEALKLPYAALALTEGEDLTIAAEYTHTHAPDGKLDTETLPLVYRSESVGQLILAPRGRGETFSQADVKLLETIAHQASIAAYNVRLTRELQRSRERLVNTREEERRRLRRDLHDGLGPVLASAAFKLDTIHNLADRDPAAARSLVSGLKTQMQSALENIRRIAYNLRPPALDELGLIGALQEHITSHNQVQGLQITLELVEALPPLPAAVEVAAYRIVLEAVSNVQRHSNAHHCRVRLALDDDLTLEISDDGQGLPDGVRAGVGLTSMRERASELGGYCIIEARPEGGTRIRAHLPLADPYN